MLRHRAAEGRTKPTRILSPAEFESLLDAIPQRHRVMVLVAIETGMRWGELVGLRVRHVDFLRRTIRVEEVIVEVSRKDSPTGERFVLKPYPKDDEARRLRITRDLVDRLARHVEDLELVSDDLLFPSNGCAGGGPISRANFRKQVWPPVPDRPPRPGWAGRSGNRVTDASRAPALLRKRSAWNRSVARRSDQPRPRRTDRVPDGRGERGSHERDRRQRVLGGVVKCCDRPRGLVASRTFSRAAHGQTIKGPTNEIVDQAPKLVRHRAKLVGLRSHCKVEIHAVLAKCGIQVLMTDLFGVNGQDLLDRVAMPGPHAARVQSLRRLIDDLDEEIDLFARLAAGSWLPIRDTPRCSSFPVSAQCSRRCSLPRSATWAGSRPRPSWAVGPG